MISRRFAIMAAGSCGTAMIVGCIIAAVAAFNISNTKNAHSSSIDEQVIEAESAPAPTTVIAETSLQESSQPEAPLRAEIAAVRTPDSVYSDAKETMSAAETPEESLPDPSSALAPETRLVQIAAASVEDGVPGDFNGLGNTETLPDASHALAPETRPVQIATVSVDDVVHGDFNGVVSVESLPDTLHALAPETPADGKRAATSTETLDECLAPEVCIDQYLWSVYQRAPKQDTVKKVERRKVTIKVGGKPRTIVKEFTTLVDEDFTWKDPKAAEKAGMSMMEYVIGGMDRDFKLKLYHALRAMDDAGLSPGITSAFRDNYRQSLASGLKAATDRSYHGGSSHGGYGHGLAADLVSVKGETRAERLVSSESLWKWIDANGKEFGIGRPYLDKDPPHVGPIDGKEYADHRRGANTQHARADTNKRNLLAVRHDHSFAKLARTAR
jgi:hypothetical protein